LPERHTKRRSTCRSSTVAPILAGVAWCALIAATSSTVILPQDLFAWLGAHVFRSESSLARFIVFWGISWFVIVKSWHAFEFALLFLLIYAALARSNPSASLRNGLLAALFSILYAILDEYHQTFVPGRGGNWRDVAIDTFGVGIGCALVCWRYERLRKKVLAGDSSTPLPP
jgi:hypothetical protein